MRMTALCVALVFFASCQTLPPPTASATITPVPAPYTKDEFPQWTHDLQRGSIITLGSLPFTVLFSTLGYSMYRFAAGTHPFPNPFAKDSASADLNSNEQAGIIATSAVISLGVGLADFIVNTVKRSNSRKKQALEDAGKSAIIILEGTP